MRFENVRDGLNVAFQDMQNIDKELKKLTTHMTSDDEVCLRINEIVASVEIDVERRWTIVVGISPPLSKYWDDNQSIKDPTDVEWTNKNDVDWKEILDCRMN
jgi:hypothetical protein